jgi:hypothetical protein
MNRTFTKWVTYTILALAAVSIIAADLLAIAE